MFPHRLDGGLRTVGQNDKLRWPAVVMSAEAYDVDLSHSGRENREKTRRGARGGLIEIPKDNQILNVQNHKNYHWKISFLKGLELINPFPFSLLRLCISLLLVPLYIKVVRFREAPAGAQKDRLRGV
jgi:hypothetical protein